MQPRSLLLQWPDDSWSLALDEHYVQRAGKEIAPFRPAQPDGSAVSQDRIGVELNNLLEMGIALEQLHAFTAHRAAQLRRSASAEADMAVRRSAAFLPTNVVYFVFMYALLKLKIIGADRDSVNVDSDPTILAMLGAEGIITAFGMLCLLLRSLPGLSLFLLLQSITLFLIIRTPFFTWGLVLVRTLCLLSVFFARAAILRQWRLHGHTRRVADSQRAALGMDARLDALEASVRGMGGQFPIIAVVDEQTVMRRTRGGVFVEVPLSTVQVAPSRPHTGEEAGRTSPGRRTRPLRSNGSRRLVLENSDPPPAPAAPGFGPEEAMHWQAVSTAVLADGSMTSMGMGLGTGVQSGAGTGAADLSVHGLGPGSSRSLRRHGSRSRSSPRELDGSSSRSDRRSRGASRSQAEESQDGLQRSHSHSGSRRRPPSADGPSTPPASRTDVTLEGQGQST